MKITFTRQEVKAVQGIIKSLNKAGVEVAKSFGQEADIEEVSVFDLVMGIESKVVSVKLGLEGLTVEINPEFVVDFLDLYGKAITATVPAVVAMFQAVQALQADADVLAEKWFNE